MSSAGPSVLATPVTTPVAGTRVWRSLGARFAILYVVVTLLAFLAVCVVVAVRTDRWVDAHGQSEAEATLARAREGWETGGSQGLRDALEQRHASASARVIDERSVELVRFATDGEAEAASELEASRGAPPSHWHAAAMHIAEGRELRIAVLDGEAESTWLRARQDIAIIAAIGVLAAVVGAFALSKHALEPVTELAHASAKVVASGDLSLRVPDRGQRGELGELGHLFNEMLARNERLVGAMKESLDNVAHDLRTPLTRLRGGAELALSHPEERAPSEALADVIEETDRVLAMLATLMDIAEAETGVLRLEKRPESLADVAREAVDLYELVAKERAVHVVTHFGTDAIVLADRGRLLQVVANVLDNALKYTPSGGRVELTTREEEGRGVLDISDTGVGIARADQPRVWDRLFRADPSRSERGLGLGLSLVRAVVEAHGGEVRLTSEPGQGTSVAIRLPRADRARER